MSRGCSALCLCLGRRRLFASPDGVNDRIAVKNRAKAITLPLLEKQNKNRLAEIDVKIDEIDAAIEKLIYDDVQLARRLRSFSPSRASQQSPLSLGSSKCPNSAASKASRPRALPASRPCKDNPAHEKATPTSAAAGLSFARPFTRRRSSLADFNKDSKAIYQKLVGAGKPAKCHHRRHAQRSHRYRHARRKDLPAGFDGVENLADNLGPGELVIERRSHKRTVDVKELGGEGDEIVDRTPAVTPLLSCNDIA